MKKHFLLALAGMLAMSALMTGPAQASPIYFKQNGLGVSGLEFQAPFYLRSFAGQVIVDRGAAGTSDDFAVYCIDITRPKTEIQDVVVRPLSEMPDNGSPVGVQPDAGARVAWLLNQYGTSEWLSTDGNYRAAALQLAIWEVLYDPYGSYNITSGNFKLLYAGSYAPLVSYANSYFAGLGNNRSEAIWYDVNLQGDRGQDFAQPASVPEPGGTMTLFGSGLAALGWFARRLRG